MQIQTCRVRSTRRSLGQVVTRWKGLWVEDRGVVKGTGATTRELEVTWESGEKKPRGAWAWGLCFPTLSGPGRPTVGKNQGGARQPRGPARFRRKAAGWAECTGTASSSEISFQGTAAAEARYPSAQHGQARSGSYTSAQDHLGAS